MAGHLNRVPVVVQVAHPKLNGTCVACVVSVHSREKANTDWLGWPQTAAAFACPLLPQTAAAFRPTQLRRTRFRPTRLPTRHQHTVSAAAGLAIQVAQSR